MAIAGLGGCAAPAAREAAGNSSTATLASTASTLAPTGVLRVGVYPGSPTSLVMAPGSSEQRGVSVELGRELARRLGVPATVVVFDRVAEVVAALKAGQVDFTVTNATPARAQDVDFTPPLVALELGYLALPASPVKTPQDADRAGIRVGVTQGSSSQAALTRDFKQAQVVAAPTLKAAGEMLQRGDIDAFATNKGILFELADSVPGAQVLPGRWGLEHLAIAVPKGRGEAADYLRRFAESARRDGLVRAAAQRAGLRGTAELP